VIRKRLFVVSSDNSSFGEGVSTSVHEPYTSLVVDSDDESESSDASRRTITSTLDSKHNVRANKPLISGVKFLFYNTCKKKRHAVKTEKKAISRVVYTEHTLFK
jgi:hypothetical protein